MHYNKEPRAIVTIHLPISLVERINEIVPKWAMENNLNPAKSKTKWYIDVIEKALDEYVSQKKMCNSSCGCGVEKRKALNELFKPKILYKIGRTKNKTMGTASDSGPFETIETAKLEPFEDGDILFEIHEDGGKNPIYIAKNGEWTDDF